MKPPNAPNAGIIIRLLDAKSHRFSNRRSRIGCLTRSSSTENASSVATPPRPNPTTGELVHPSVPARESAYSVIAAPALPVMSPRMSIWFCAYASLCSRSTR